MKSICLKQWEVKAALDGNLKQVRRVNTLHEFRPCTNVPGSDWYFRDKKTSIWSDVSNEKLLKYYCPFSVGDIVAVKEHLEAEQYASRTWSIIYSADQKDVSVYGDPEAEIPSDWEPGNIKTHKEVGDNIPGGQFYWYTASIPSNHMPLWAVRSHLVITGVRCEKVQEISDEDALKCGVEYLFSQEECDTTAGIIGSSPKDHGYKNYLWHGEHGLKNKQVDGWDYQFSGYESAKDSYSSLWQRDNFRYPWDTNPWQWVYDVEVK